MEDPLRSPPRSGGAIEPADRQRARVDGQPAGAAAKLPDPSKTRYELRDPFAEVTYRGRSFAEMAQQADRLGAQRFTAIDAQGQRSTVAKREGRWPPAPDAQPARGPVAATPNRASPSEREALEAGLHDRYLVRRPVMRIGKLAIGPTEYRFRGENGRVAFTASPMRLSTETNNPAVARSMVDLAESRHWRGLRVSGHEDFRRQVWLEASLRGIQTVGYEPVPGDAQRLKQEREARQGRGEASARPGAASTPAEANAAGKPSQRGGGRKAVLAALDAVLIAQGIPERKREVVMAVAAESLAQRLARGETHRVKVWDRDAPPQRGAVPSPTAQPVRDPQRPRDRPGPTR